MFWANIKYVKHNNNTPDQPAQLAVTCNNRNNSNNCTNNDASFLLALWPARWFHLWYRR